MEEGPALSSVEASSLPDLGMGEWTLQRGCHFQWEDYEHLPYSLYPPFPLRGIAYSLLIASHLHATSGR